jgi:hypothetical protein
VKISSAVLSFLDAGKLIYMGKLVGAYLQLFVIKASNTSPYYVNYVNPMPQIIVWHKYIAF